MMTFPGSPHFNKGAIVAIDISNPNPRIIAFQYNPETVSRTIQAKTSGDEGDKSEPLRLSGAPVETIKLDIEMDATDEMEAGNPLAIASGIYPQLSALEILIYPNSSLVIANNVLAAAGTMEISPPLAPLTLFVWGPGRVLPVRLTDFSITEEAHDLNLNPIRAKVSLGMRVLSYNDLPITNPGYYIFLAHQKIKESMAKIGSASSMVGAAGAMINPSLSVSASVSVSGSVNIG